MRERYLRGTFLLILLLFLTGCSGIILNRQRIVPTSMANSPDELVVKISSLKVGTSLEEAIDALGIKSKTPGVRDIVERSDKQRILYGNVNVVGTPKEIEEFNEKIDRHRILGIRFEDLRQKLHLDSPISALTTKTGPQLVIYLIFYEGKLKEAPRIPTNFYVSGENRSYIFSILGRIFGTAIDAGISAGKATIK